MLSGTIGKEFIPVRPTIGTKLVGRAGIHLFYKERLPIQIRVSPYNPVSSKLNDTPWFLVGFSQLWQLIPAT